MATSVIVFYQRLTPVVANAGAGETRLLSAGTQGPDWTGTLSPLPLFGNFARGWVIRINAWGTTTNTDSANGTARIKLYYNPGASLANQIADSGATRPQLTPPNEAVPWWFYGQILVQTVGASGGGWCESLFENVEDPTNYNKMCGGGSFALNTTVGNNTLELTVNVSNHGFFVLNMCTIELLGNGT
jgi:hypothetical protein